MKRRTYRILVAALCVALVAATPTAVAAKPAERPNVLLITLDDMNWDSLGCTGTKVPVISPNIDGLAKQGLRFLHAHVAIAVCQPTRSVWFTGRYPHRNGALGFQPINPAVPTLTEQTKKAGYFNGIMAKVPHLAPQRKFAWDVLVNAGELGVGRDPDLYYKHAKAFFERAKTERKPFFLMANSQDPHRPFAGSPQEAARRGKVRKKKRKQRPSNFPGVRRTYRPNEITVPKFLPDIPEVRQEMAEYFTSVHRADEIVGAVLKALKETGFEKNTLVIFLSDHGMPLPFAKTNCYLNSTRTPLIVRWPGFVKPETVETVHMVSGIDLMPTILDALKLPAPKGMDGRSFLPILDGKKQDGRDELYTVFHRTAGRRDFEMRSVLTKKHGYIYNAWSDGKTVFRNESQNGRTFRAMVAAARTNPLIAARVKLFQYRVKEEFYDYETDPAALKNLIDDPQHRGQIDRFRARMRQRMKELNDPLQKTYEREAWNRKRSTGDNRVNRG
jgi:N-sulfoglucosamine sulfohydrolase